LPYSLEGFMYYMYQVVLRRGRTGMTEEVVITRKGQTTIPVRLRRKYKIQEGSIVEAIDTGSGILLKPKESFCDLAGAASGKATVAEMKKMLDRMRSEDER